MKSKLRALLVTAFLPAASCTMQAGDELPEGPAVAAAEQPIIAGAPVGVDNPYWRYTVLVQAGGWCTGTIISPHHILTAAHCGPTTLMNNRVWFYNGNALDGNSVLVDNVYMKSGVSSSDTTDSSGKFADFAILQIDKDIGTINPNYRIAALPSAYAGSGGGGTQVGAGNHDGVTNDDFDLRFRTNTFWSSVDDDGSFQTSFDGTNEGDSGGPFFTSKPDGQLIVHGGLWGLTYDWFGYRNRYTSVAYHLQSINQAMGNVNVYNWNYYGNDIDMKPSLDRNECAAACLQNASCSSWTLDPQPAGAWRGNCWLKNSQGGGFAQGGLTSGYKRNVAITRTDWNYGGNDLPGSPTENSFGGCQTACYGRSDCQAWTFVPVSPGAGYGQCWLKSTVGAGGSALTGVSSGHKTTTLPCTLSGGVCTI